VEGAAISVIVFFFLHVTVACASRSLCSVAGVRVLCPASLSRDEGPHVDACSDVRAVPFFSFPLRIFTRCLAKGKEGAASASHPFRNRHGFIKRAFSEGGRDMSRKARWGVRAALRVSFCVLFFRSFLQIYQSVGT